jgi:hypothetical protein
LWQPRIRRHGSSLGFFLAATSSTHLHSNTRTPMIDPATGIPSLKPHRSEGQRPSAKRLEQEIKARTRTARTSVGYPAVLLVGIPLTPL